MVAVSGRGKKEYYPTPNKSLRGWSKKGANQCGICSLCGAPRFVCGRIIKMPTRVEKRNAETRAFTSGGGRDKSILHRPPEKPTKRTPGFWGAV